MWPFKKTPKEDVDINRCLRIVDDYLSLIPEQGPWDDRELHSKLVSMRHSKFLSWYVIGILPIVAGRDILVGLGPKLSDKLVLYDIHGKPSKLVLLSAFAPAVAVARSIKKIRSHPNRASIMSCSAEIGVVNKLMSGGSNPQKLVLTEPGLTHPG